MSVPLNVRNAPSSRLVFTYLLASLASFVLLTGWSALHYAEWGGFYAGPRFLAWVHLAVLGWINLVIFGVLFQFVPVVLDVRLASEKLAWWQLVFYVPGAAGMIWCFWIGRFDWPLHTFASVLWIGFALFIWNMLVTYRKVSGWTLTAKCIYAAVLYLLATIMLGLFLSIHIAYPMIGMSHLTLMKLHAHAGIAGWFMMIVMGVSMKMLPMFLISYGYSTRPAEAAFYLLNGGLLTWGLAVAFSFGPVWEHIGIAALAAGIFSYLIQVFIFYRTRNRVRSDPFRRKSVRQVEFPLRFAGGAYGLLAAVALAGLAVVYLKPLAPVEYRNGMVLVYGATLFLGFCGLLIQAFLYKIVPFLIWLKKFSNTAGRVRTPKIVELVPSRAAVGQLFTYCAGAAFAVAGLAVESQPAIGTGAVLMFAGSLWLIGNLVVCWKRAVPLGPLTAIPSCEGLPPNLSSAEAASQKSEFL